MKHEINNVDDLIDLVLGRSGLTDRFLQDSPLLADVWRAFAEKPNRRIDVLITPNRTTPAASVAGELKSSLAMSDGAFRNRETNLAWLQGTVAARLSFSELVLFTLPRTGWFAKRLLVQLGTLNRESVYRASALWILTLDAYGASAAESDSDPAGRFNLPHRYRIASDAASVNAEFLDIARYIFLIGVIASLDQKNLQFKDYLVQSEGQWPIDDVAKHAWLVLKDTQNQSLQSKTPSIFHVSLNRPVTLAIRESIPTVKGDASLDVFDINCRTINWAMLDSGIDASHPAFADHNNAQRPGDSRVLAAYDFTSLRSITSLDLLLHDGDRQALAAALSQQSIIAVEDIDARLEKLGQDLDEERPLDWELIEPVLQLPKFVEPLDHHGTHVAGTLAADWRVSGERKMVGLCPDIRLYDFRVVGHSLEDTEFAIIGALQYIRWLNDRNNFIAIHGANLSLQLQHDVRNYACGQTPICLECERVVDNGTVIVAAAGNLGSHVFHTANGPYRGYANSSITDPGNADSVITVGATHRYKPHSYGVSYFSGRGPTGDGRLKPDIVAPGEKIDAPALGATSTRLDGTSMAAPHVSGAAAMIMARHKEFVGKPREIKEILMSTATDLGREHYFQGSGLLDIFRALQSV